VGCGNGRFGVFLGEQGIACAYHGTDNNPTLLALAQEALQAYPHVIATFSERDSIVQAHNDTEPVDERYDFVGVFGVLHHVPGASHRLDFVRALAQRVADGGILALAMWRFYEFARFQERIVAWDDDLAPMVEKNDFLLDWRRGERALRYCHYIDDDEQNTLIRATELTLLESYRADGYNNAVNSYVVLQK
jgi:tRNA (uracil-5-)-methyltransferase TRM9